MQETTKEIVAALRQLAPDKLFHPWFDQIIAEGTGHEFSFADNKDWLRKGRPILESFFHARMMLALAVKYGNELEHAPRTMPSGWAALRQLYAGVEIEGETTEPSEENPARDERFRL